MVEGKIIYLDNAATSYPKPEAVYQAHDAILRRAGNPGRGAHRLSLNSASIVFESRSAIASFLGIKSVDHLLFTAGCTYSLNTVLKGLDFSLPDGRSPVVIVSALEHNSVMRPLSRLERAGTIKMHRLKYASGGVIDRQELQEAVKTMKPRLCVIQEGSNVSGELIDIASGWEICREQGVDLLIDAAQTAGAIPTCLPELIAARNDTTDGGSALFWCTSGHKSLLGPLGIGLLFAAGAPHLEPLITGGTGSNSENLEMPFDYPDRFESGTQPVQLIGALAEAVTWLSNEGVKVRQHEIELTNRFLNWCAERPYMQIVGSRPPGTYSTNREDNLKAGLPIVSFAMRGVAADQVADLLDREFGIAVRAGLHCAMSAHEAFGSLKTGLTRVSFAYSNTTDEIDQLCEALASIQRQSHR